MRMTMPSLRSLFHGSRKLNGLLFVATGARHRAEARMCVERILSNACAPPITVVTDLPEDFNDIKLDQVIRHRNPCQTYRDKIEPLLHLPYKYTLFLDTDIEILGTLDDLFLLLRYVDICGCHAPVRWAQWRDPAVPESFPELNSGVVGLQRNRRTRSLVRRWLQLYDHLGVAFDQASLRCALWESTRRQRLRLSILPPEYNLRTTKPWIAGQGMAVKIVHGRVDETLRPALRTYLNTNINVFRSSSHLNTGLNGVVAAWPSEITKRLFIVGAGRSGTSLLAGLFQHSGLHMGDQPYLAREANPTGFFEDRLVNTLNEELLSTHAEPELAEGQRWLSAIGIATTIPCSSAQAERMREILSSKPSCLKDPRFCYTLHNWLASLSAKEAESSLCLCVFRDPLTVVSSTLQELAQAPYLRNLQRTPNQILDAWAQHYTWVLRHQSKRGRWLFIHYDALFGPKELDRLEAFTGCSINRKLPTRSLRRSKPHAIAMPANCEEIYATLQVRATKD